MLGLTSCQFDGVAADGGGDDDGLGPTRSMSIGRGNEQDQKLQKIEQTPREGSWKMII